MPLAPHRSLEVLLTSLLRALGVIDEQSWETSIEAHTGWFVFTWCTLLVYLALFLIAFTVAVRHITGSAMPRAALVAFAAFSLFQGVEIVFIR